MRVEPNSMPRTVFPLSIAVWVSFRLTISHLDDDFQSLTPLRHTKRFLGIFERKTMRYQGTHIDQSLRHQLDRARVGMFHAPYELDGETFSSRRGCRKGCFVIVRDSCQQDFSAGGNSIETCINRILC